MTYQNTQSSPRFIKLEPTAVKTGMGKSTVLAWEAQGKFPRAIRLSPTLRVWLESDVDKWMLEQHANSSSSAMGGAK